MRDASPRAMSAQRFFAAALAELQMETSESAVPRLVELQRVGTREVFERAVGLTHSSLVLERVLGVRALRELGGIPPRFAEETVPRLLAMLAEETSPDVLRWVVSAIGYMHMIGRARPRIVQDPRVLPAVVRHAQHEDGQVRFAVAAALPSLVDVERPEPMAIAALVHLSADASSDTRYYALAALTDDLHLTHLATVTRALEARANDPDEQVRRAARRVLNGSSWAEP